jgi:hypothetical protein
MPPRIRPLYIGLVLGILGSCSVAEEGEEPELAWRLYRSGMMGLEVKVYVATFDAKERWNAFEDYEYNKENCESARDHFNTNPLYLAGPPTYFCEFGNAG